MTVFFVSPCIYDLLKNVSGEWKWDTVICRTIVEVIISKCSI